MEINTSILFGGSALALNLLGYLWGVSKVIYKVDELYKSTTKLESAVSEMSDEVQQLTTDVAILQHYTGLKKL